MELTLVELRNKLAEIPEERWITGTLSNSFRNEFNDNDCCCVLGHYDRISGIKCGNLEYLLAKTSFGLAAKNFLYNKYDSDIPPYYINDGMLLDYTQETPKLRSLALIDDMIKAGIEL